MSASRILSEIEVESYRRDGFLVPRYQLPAAAVLQLRLLTDKLVIDNPTLVDEPLVNPHIPGSGTQLLKSDHGFRDIATHPEVLDLVEELIGPDIILWSSLLFYKRPVAGPLTPWHRDGYSYPITPLETTSVWIAVYESTIQNGCLRFIPGSHAERRAGDHDRT